jgi:outer membrane receptor protein involved in Fe transport
VNYELGAKGDLIGKELTIDGSVYFIDWTDIQVSLTAPNGFAYTGNAGRATSKGIELSVTSRPIEGLTIAAWGTLASAEINSLPANLAPFSPLVGSVGQQLPWAARVSGNLSINDEFPLRGNFIGFVGGAVTYIGDRKDQFAGSSPRQDLPGYAKVDARAGVRSQRWAANLYLNNAANRRGVISGGTSVVNFPPGSTYIIQPRTIGLNVTYTF